MPESVHELRMRADELHADFCRKVAEAFPGADEWTWQRAVAHMAGENVRRNDDTSRDSEIAADVSLREAWDSYIAALHRYYETRHGPNGVLGGLAPTAAR